MKKKKWMLAAALSAAMVSSSILSVPADASFQLMAEVPEGYEITDRSIFVTQNACYPVYWKISDHNAVLVLTDYLCNFVEIEVPTTPENMVSKYEEIKEKYADLVGTFDQYMQNEDTYYGVVRVVMFDTLDEEGNLIKDPSAIKSKRGEMQKMCQELQEAGVVTSASYASYIVNQNFGRYCNGIFVDELPQTELESLEAFVAQQFGEEITVRWVEIQDERDEDFFVVDGFQNVDETFAAQEILEKQFEGIVTDVPACLEESLNMCKVGAVNLLTAADACGDIDQDGTVSVEDAVSALTYYAQQSAGLEPKLTQAAATEESAFLAADVNGDGQVTIEDAVAILTYYAKKSAGLDAAW